MQVMNVVNTISATKILDWNSRGLQFPGLDMEMYICQQANTPMVSLPGRHSPLHSAATFSFLDYLNYQIPQGRNVYY